MAGKRVFGSIRKLPSGRHQARYLGPNGRSYSAKTADGTALTFDTRGHADAWLARISASISEGRWEDPDSTKPGAMLFGQYAEAWLAERDLQVRTRELYASLLARRILPTFGAVPIIEITPAAVRAWHAAQGTDTPTARTHAYQVLRTVLGEAVRDDLITANPCRIRGASITKAAKKTRPATREELAAIVAALPPRYRAMALLACWCSLRFGELAELRRADLDLDAAVIRVRRAVVTTKANGVVVKEPKSAAGIRDVTIPAHIIPALREHLREHAQPGKRGLLFPGAAGQHMAASALHRVYNRARAVAGRPDLSWHDLRHTGQTYAAATGANLRELMARAGQSSPGAALRYLHEVDGRQREIADRLAEYGTADTAALR